MAGKANAMPRRLSALAPGNAADKIEHFAGQPSLWPELPAALTNQEWSDSSDDDDDDDEKGGVNIEMGRVRTVELGTISSNPGQIPNIAHVTRPPSDSVVSVTINNDSNESETEIKGMEEEEEKEETEKEKEDTWLRIRYSADRFLILSPVIFHFADIITDLSVLFS